MYSMSFKKNWFLKFCKYNVFGLEAARWWLKNVIFRSFCADRRKKKKRRFSIRDLFDKYRYQSTFSIFTLVDPIYRIDAYSTLYYTILPLFRTHSTCSSLFSFICIVLFTFFPLQSGKWLYFPIEMHVTIWRIVIVSRGKIFYRNNAIKYVNVTPQLKASEWIVSEILFDSYYP